MFMMIINVNPTVPYSDDITFIYTNIIVLLLYK